MTYKEPVPDPREMEILKKLMDEARTGALDIKSCIFSPNILAAADHVFKNGQDPGEYQGFLLGVAWAILTDQI